MADLSGPLNLKQVAQELGVHYMTAYRYVRQGHLPAERAGNVWLVHPEALAAFRDRAHPARGSVDRVARLHRRLVAGDETGAARVLDDALAAGTSPSDCHLVLLAGALARVGAEVDDGRRDDAESRVAITVATRLVAQLGARFRHRGRARGVVVLGGPPGEHHALALAIVANVVRLQGFTVVELGTDVPLAAFEAALDHVERPLAVGVGVTMAERLPAALVVVEGLRRRHPDLVVLLGGQGVRNEEIAGLHGATGWAADAHELVDALEAVARPRRATPR